MGKGAGAPSKNVFASAVRQSLENALTEADRIRIHIACDDIPHSLTPFKDWGVSCDELREDIAAERMRRFGAILRHQDAGFPFSHCYERPSFENFPYNLYAMMHAQTPEELDGYIKESVTLLGNPEFVVLHSLKELKKTSFRFFA